MKLINNCDKKSISSFYFRIISKQIQSKRKMVKGIIKYYSDFNNIIDIVTARELKLLSLIVDNKEIDREKYWPLINCLNKKLILDGITIYEEIIDYVKKALSEVNYNEINDEAVIGLIGLCKVYGVIDKNTLLILGENIYSVDCEKLLDRSIFKLYVDNEDNLLKYENTLKSNIPYIHRFNKNELENIFYYDFDVANPIISDGLKLLSFDELRILKNYIYSGKGKYLIYRDEISSFLDSIPLSFLGGNTYIECDRYKKRCSYEKMIFSKKQDDNTLNDDAADLFYKVYDDLLSYTTGFSVKENRDAYILGEKKLLKSKSIISDFISSCKFNYTLEELDLLYSLDESICDFFVLIKYDHKYAHFLTRDKKIFLVKMVNVNLDRIIPASFLPCALKASLFMYFGEIVCFNLYVLDKDYDDEFKIKAYEEYLNSKVSNTLKSN